MVATAKSIETVGKNDSGWQNFFRRLPFVRNLKQTSPPYHIGSIIENRPGLQIGRVVGKQIARGSHRQ